MSQYSIENKWLTLTLDHVQLRSNMPTYPDRLKTFINLMAGQVWRVQKRCLFGLLFLVGTVESE
jgi:hypothetical protein